MEYANDSADASKINAIYAANPSLLNIPNSARDYNAINCARSSPVDFLYLSTIRGGRKMNGGGCGCGANSGGSSGGSSGGFVGGGVSGLSMGGCFTCKKGVANITHIYSTIHIVIPTLYKKYKAVKAAKAVTKAKKVVKKTVIKRRSY
jgi:hypothetical protein